MRLIQNTTGSFMRLDTEKGHVDIPPGYAEVDSEKWELAKRNPAVAARLSAKMLRDKGETSIDKLSPAQAAKVAQGTFDVARLKTWLAAEKRELVKVAIEDQLEKIDAKAKTGESDGEDEEDDE